MRIVQTDVFIVGSGPAGCTYARTILESTDKVVFMAEMGTQQSSILGENLKNAAYFQKVSFAVSRGLSHYVSATGGSPVAGSTLSCFEHHQLRCLLENATDPSRFCRTSARSNMSSSAISTSSSRTTRTCRERRQPMLLAVWLRTGPVLLLARTGMSCRIPTPRRSGTGFTLPRRSCSAPT